MFFFSITRNSIKLLIKNCNEIIHSNFFFTYITDNFLSSFRSTNHSFQIVESLHPYIYNTENYYFVKLDLNTKEKKLTIHKTLVAGRPVYYHINKNGEFFCTTHIKYFRTVNIILDENTKVIPELFLFRTVMPPFTIYKNIMQLTTGSHLILSFENDKCNINAIDQFQLPDIDYSINNIGTAAKQTYHLLENTFKYLSLFKNNTSLLFSGGIDSSTLACLGKKNIQLNNTYSTSYPFEEEKFNRERIYPNSAAKKIEVKNNHYICTPIDYFYGIIDSIYNCEEPVHHFQSILIHLLFKNCTPAFFNIILSGQGAASSYGNLASDVYYIEKNLIRKCIKKGFYRLSNNKAFFQPMLLPIDHVDHPLWKWKSYGLISWINNYFNTNKHEILSNRINFINSLQYKSIYNIWSYYSLVAYEDSTMYLWSKIAEANQKILYYPYYDDKLLSYVLSIPWEIKLKLPHRILVRELAKLSSVPKFIIKRPQGNFGLVTNRWAIPGGYFENILPIIYKIIPKNELNILQSTDSRKNMTLWNALNYAIWKRIFIFNESPDDLKKELKSYMV